MIEGEAILLDAALSFWGGFDPATGKVVDVHHPQCGARLAGRIVLMRESQGSGTASSALAEAIRLGTAPAAIILETTDINLAIGAEAASFLYGKTCAVVAVSPKTFQRLRGARRIGISGANISVISS